MFKFLKDKLSGAISKFSKKAEEAPEAPVEKPEVVEEIKREEIKEEKPAGEKPVKAKEEKKEEVKEIKAEPKEEIKKEPVKEVVKEKPKEEKKGFFAKITEKVTTTRISEGKLDELFWDLELAMMENNVAVEVIEKIKNDLKKNLVDVPIKRSDVKEVVIKSLRASIEGLFSQPDFDLVGEIKKSDKPYVIVFVGVNGSGKCVTGDTLIPLANGDLIKIRELYKRHRKNEIILNNERYIMNPPVEVFSLDRSLNMVTKEILALCKLKSPPYLREVCLSNGMSIKVTAEHPLLVVQDGCLVWLRAEHIKEGMYVAVPRKLSKKITYDPNGEMLKRLGDEFFVEVSSYEKILDHLKAKYGTLIGAYKGLGIKRSYSSFVGHWRHNNILPIKLYLKLKDETNIRPLSLRFGGSKSIPFPMLNKDLAELVGLVLAEGHLDEKVCEVTNKDIKLIERFKFLNKKLFHKDTKVFIDSRGLIRARVHNWAIIRILHDAFEVPFGNKSHKLAIPKLILRGDDELIKSFLRSYIEAEGHIGLNKRVLELPTASKKAALGLIHLLLMLGIETTLSKKVTKNGTFYRVYITGASKFEKLPDLNLYSDKNKIIEYNNKLPKQFEITNLVPECGGYIKELRIKRGIFQKKISERIGCTPSLISQYESGVSIPRGNVLQIADMLKSKYMLRFGTSEISWVRVSEARKVKSKGKWVYDLSMDNSNFVANNIISHNTTTIAKFVQYLKNNHLSCVIAASDTFRAAAIQQLEEHGEKLGVKVVKHDYGADPAAVAFDAEKYAQAHKIDVVLVDTAGRMHSNSNLVDEMKKIIRVAKPNLKIFVGESITGNDCVEQAKTFNEAVGLDGIVLSKADIDEKGGAAISVSYVTGKPILFLGMGQDYGDLEKFDKEKIIKSIGL